MRFKRIILGLLLTLMLVLVPVVNVSASTQDFYFRDFTADYYLIKAEDGTSKLHVKEVLTAVFPDYDQNHGINREIPMYNQGMKNRTIKSQEALNLTVLRNGLPEKINKIENEGRYYNAYIGDANTYVHGEQVYTLEYDFTDVITEFDEDLTNVSGQEDVVKLFQELYWDTNGTDWKQEFGKITARLHLTPDVLERTQSDTWCYVGRYGENGAERCTSLKTDDGFIFSAENLKSGENLTFVVNFDPETFKVVLEKSYILVILLVAEIVIALIVIIRSALRWHKEASKQRNHYRSLFTAPQYQPPEDKSIRVAEGEQIYLKKTKPSYVATLLELAVNKSISIIKVQDEKRPRKTNWMVHINVEPTTLSTAQTSMLNILANKSNISKDDDIVIEKHTATKTLAGYAKSYKKNAEYVLNREKYINKEKIPKDKSGIISTIVSKIFIYAIVLIVGAATFEGAVEELFGEAVVIVGGEYLPFIMIDIFIITLIINTIIRKRTEKYAKYTTRGIDLAKYLEGLEMYIKMAEKDRLAFLQSVEGTDTSNAGIVKLYEKLLPWAALFGAEKSWMKELSRYYEISDVPEEINANSINSIIASDIIRSSFINDISRVVDYSINYHEPSGGSGSSFSSGGGGGGFSGGGGGGGGGGGW